MKTRDRKVKERIDITKASMVNEIETGFLTTSAYSLNRYGGIAKNCFKLVCVGNQ